MLQPGYNLGCSVSGRRSAHKSRFRIKVHRPYPFALYKHAMKGQCFRCRQPHTISPLQAQYSIAHVNGAKIEQNKLLLPPSFLSSQASTEGTSYSLSIHYCYDASQMAGIIVNQQLISFGSFTYSANPSNGAMK